MLKRALILFFLALSEAQELIGYDCTDASTPAATVSLIANNHCVKQKPNITISRATIQLVQTKTYDVLDYFACDITYKVLIQQCGSW